MASNSHPPGTDWSQTLIGMPADWVVPVHLHSISLDKPTIGDALFGTRQRFKIRFASAGGTRESANLLVRRMYAKRGYETTEPNSAPPDRITLTADVEHNIIGTLTIGLGHAGGLVAEQLYPEEIAQLRAQGARLCEYTKLAIDGKIRSKRVLAALFHIGYLYPYRVLGLTDGVLEVNPRHAGFYRKMLGFTQIGPERMCKRVNAPAVLLRTNFAFVAEQVRKFGGHGGRVQGEDSLYPYFLSPRDEQGVTERLMRGG